jgi:hypothetical protein
MSRRLALALVPALYPKGERLAGQTLKIVQ